MAVDVIDIDISKVDLILDRYGKQQRGLMNSLLEIQNEFHYLPSDALRRVSERMEVPLIQVYQVASFYKAFSLKPRGAHVITVCLGTACHVRGGERLLDQIERLLDIKAGETTKDHQFTLEAVNCLGVCALGPVMVLDGKYYGSMAASKVEKVLEKFTKKEVANG
jgi:NADH-quinone oxidoreductase subunit E